VDRRESVGRVCGPMVTRGRGSQRAVVFTGTAYRPVPLPVILDFKPIQLIMEIVSGCEFGAVISGLI
jgi:hypothetical protein